MSVDTDLTGPDAAVTSRVRIWVETQQYSSRFE